MTSSLSRRGRPGRTSGFPTATTRSVNSTGWPTCTVVAARRALARKMPTASVNSFGCPLTGGVNFSSAPSSWPKPAAGRASDTATARRTLLMVRNPCPGLPVLDRPGLVGCRAAPLAFSSFPDLFHRRREVIVGLLRCQGREGVVVAGRERVARSRCVLLRLDRVFTILALDRLVRLRRAAAAPCRVAPSRAGVLVVHRRVFVAAAVLPVLVFVLRLPRVLRRHAQPEELGQFEIVPGVLGDLAVGTAQALAVTANGQHQRPCLVAAALHETVRQA